jgi:hypothetical protein
MTHPLSRVPVLGQFVDERFLEHRRRASSTAGIVTACLTIGLFEYRFLVEHIWSWDLMALALIFLTIKMSMFAWYRFNA